LLFAVNLLIKIKFANSFSHASFLKLLIIYQTVQNLQTNLESIGIQTIVVQKIHQGVLSLVRSLTNSQNEINAKIEYLEQEKVCEEDIEKLYTELLEASKGEEGLDVSRITNSY